jgi:euchromatic histone-lysine N-methyltransferase
VKDFAPRPDIIIDSGQTGNASRFINHSCSPNVFAQCVLWDHDGAKHPHIMLFAMDNITPFDELTLDYGTQNPSLNSRWVAKHCLCKSEECKGVFYT